jgi:hypothetical protein
VVSQLADRKTPCLVRTGLALGVAAVMVRYRAGGDKSGIAENTTSRL